MLRGLTGLLEIRCGKRVVGVDCLRRGGHSGGGLPRLKTPANKIGGLVALLLLALGLVGELGAFGGRRIAARLELEAKLFDEAARRLGLLVLGLLGLYFGTAVGGAGRVGAHGQLRAGRVQSGRARLTLDLGKHGAEGRRRGAPHSSPARLAKHLRHVAAHDRIVGGHHLALCLEHWRRRLERVSLYLTALARLLLLRPHHKIVVKLVVRRRHTAVCLLIHGCRAHRLIEI